MPLEHVLWAMPDLPSLASPKFQSICWPDFSNTTAQLTVNAEFGAKVTLDHRGSVSSGRRLSQRLVSSEASCESGLSSFPGMNALSFLSQALHHGLCNASPSSTVSATSPVVIRPWKRISEKPRGGRGGSARSSSSRKRGKKRKKTPCQLSEKGVKTGLHSML